jgi:medium-chain acyl-[acyl-carrier-protein] hydrolase
MPNHSPRPSATSAPSPSRWLWKPRLSASPRLRLFCLPYAGGAGSLFRDWFDLVPADIDLCPIQLPGREARFTEPHIDDPRVLLEALQQAIQPWLDRPFVLFGYSMGALVAHALAQRLQDTGGPLPERLVLAACSSPEHPTSVDPDALSDAAFTAHVRALGGTPAAVFEHAELLALVLPLLKADFRLVRRLREVAGSPSDLQRLRCPVTALAAHQDTHATPQQVARWADCTQAGVRLHSIAGGHFALWQQPRLLVDAALER